MVPSHADVVPSHTSSGVYADQRTAVASSDNGIKAAVGLLQTIYAIYTLYRVRGRQLELWGYAAFGLTVIPYLIMSICNLLAQILSPDYAALYMVRTPEMDEAERRGGVFEGTVARLQGYPFDEDEVMRIRV